jgi:hypothetical protein
MLYKCDLVKVLGRFSCAKLIDYYSLHLKVLLITPFVHGIVKVYKL